MEGFTRKTVLRYLATPTAATAAAMPYRSGSTSFPETDFNRTLGADSDAFSLHASVRCSADDRKALEQLCGHITRPALANECVPTNATGQVGLKLETPWRDGTKQLGMSALEFMQRLAAVVPRPRLQLTRLVSA